MEPTTGGNENEKPNEGQIQPPQQPSETPATTHQPHVIHPGESPAQTYTPPANAEAPANTPSTKTGKKQSSNKKALILLASLAGVAILSLSYVFGFYLPNKPENVWKTGLVRSGEALEEMVTQATEAEQIKQFQNSKITGNASFNSEGFTFSGNLLAKLNEKKSDSSVDVVFQDEGDPEKTASLRALTSLAENAKYPDVYLKVEGVSTFGVEDLVPQIDQYEGKWIAVGADYLESVMEQQGMERKSDNQDNVTSEEYAEIARTVTATTKEYVFTDDAEKAVLENRGFIGKEEVDGKQTYHYESALNQDNVEKYCVALTERVIDTTGWQKLFDLDAAALEKSKAVAKEECKHDQDRNTKDDGVFDLWVDTKYKLIYKIRDYTNPEKTDYIEIGQRYDGGDEFGLFQVYHGEESQFDGRLELSTNIQNNTAKLELTLAQAKEDGFLGEFDFKASFNAEPLNEEIDVSEPEGTIKIEDILEELNSAPEDEILLEDYEYLLN